MPFDHIVQPDIATGRQAAAAHAMQWRVGAAGFDCVTRRLVMGGAVVELEHRATGLLALLLASPGQIVTKTDIMDALWGERSVTEASLAKCVSRLRAALGDTDHRLIRTAHGVGYRIDPAWVSSVQAMPAALAAPAAALPVSAISAVSAGRRHWLRAVVAGGLIACAASGLAVTGLRGRAHVHVPPDMARALYLKGIQDWARRTPEALNQAVQELTAAIHLDPDYAEAYVGLANCYNLLPEFSAMPSAQAFPLARRAAETAAALDPTLAGAHAAHAFTLFYGDWDFTGGFAEYEQALRLEPANPAFHHWYATSLAAVGHFRLALLHINRALELDPASLAIRADRGCLLMNAGTMDEARAVLTKLAAEAPGFISTHRYLADLALMTGDDAGYVREAMRLGETLHDDTVIGIARAAQAGLLAGGHRGFLAALLEARLTAFSRGALSAMDVASAYAMLGDRTQAMRYVNLAIDRHDEAAIFVYEPGLRDLVRTGAFAEVFARLGVPPPGE